MPTPAIDGPRACTPGEVPEVIALVDGAMRAGSDQSILTDYPLVYEAGNLQNVRILKVGGELATVVPFIPWQMAAGGCSFRVGIISPTATAVKHRKKGYGLLCLRNCIGAMGRAGCDLSVLWTMPATFPFYEHADYQAVGSPGWVYRCMLADAAAFVNHGEKIIPYNAGSGEHLEALLALHELDDAGIVRPAGRFAALLNLPKMRTLVALRRGAPAAYLVVSRATNKPGIVEAGGDILGVETLMNRVLGEIGEGESLDAYGYLSNSVLGGLLEERLTAGKQAMPAGQMIRIHAPREFIGKLGPWLAANNRRGERALSLAIDDEMVSVRFSRHGVHVGQEQLAEHYRLGRRELVSLIFGLHPSLSIDLPAALADLSPLYFPIWILDRS